MRDNRFPYTESFSTFHRRERLSLCTVEKMDSKLVESGLFDIAHSADCCWYLKTVQLCNYDDRSIHVCWC